MLMLLFLLFYILPVCRQIKSLPMHKDQEIVRLHMAPLANSVIGHAKAWVQCLSKLLNDSAKENLFNLKGELEAKREDLCK